MSFIAFEGLDGSGKSTQVRRLCSYFDHNKLEYKFLHFPIIDEPNFGLLISRFLRGEMGSIAQVDPWIVAMLFAGNRWSIADDIRKYLSNNILVIVDRYVYSNMAYQVAKISNKEEKVRLRDWIYRLEYKTFNLPKPDINIFLDVPLGFVEQQLGSKRSGSDRSYLQGGDDIHEADISFQRKVFNEYDLCSSQYTDLIRVPCYDRNGVMLDEETIFSRLLSTITSKTEILKQKSQ